MGTRALADEIVVRHLELRRRDGFLRVLASDAPKLHGLTPSCVYLGEEQDIDDLRAANRANPASWITAEGLREQREAVPELAFRRFHLNQWHSSIAISFDRYGHLMPGSQDEARELIDAYLGRNVGDLP
jgi:hypothetical protein